ncbi:MAG: GNAT family N-acetyltransferase [Hyphomicrobiales bacterium]|nr:GNAT family N-acetyltransferase [Hyphomicrobiales bacterium]
MVRIEPVTERTRAAAVDLLTRFFQEEGFALPTQGIAANLAFLLDNGAGWAALARHEDDIVGIVTVTTMYYVEWGRYGEIGDLYVLPPKRRRGIARHLVAAAADWCRRKGCSAVSVTITPEGDTRHDLSKFYERMNFRRTGRTIMSAALAS